MSCSFGDSMSRTPYTESTFVIASSLRRLSDLGEASRASGISSRIRSRSNDCVMPSPFGAGLSPGRVKRTLGTTPSPSVLRSFADSMIRVIRSSVSRLVESRVAPRNCCASRFCAVASCRRALCTQRMSRTVCGWAVLKLSRSIFRAASRPCLTKISQVICLRRVSSAT